MPRREATLDRFALDRIARAVVSGRRGYGRRVDALADAVAARMKNRLAAAEVPGVTRAARLPVRPFSDRRLLGVLVERTAKHLASAVVLRTARGRAHVKRTPRSRLEPGRNESLHSVVQDLPA